MQPKMRSLIAVPVVCVSLIPALHDFMSHQSAQKAKQTAINQQSEANQEAIREIESETQQGIAISLERAKTCIMISPSTPITEGSIVTYGKTNRKLPGGATVCDLNAGKTADIASGGRAIDIRNIAPEKLKQALSTRQQ